MNMKEQHGIGPIGIQISRRKSPCFLLPIRLSIGVWSNKDLPVK